MIKRGNILLVDDDLGFLTALTKMLSKQGYEVVGTTSAAAALEEIQDQKRDIDLVVTDLSMPTMSGRAILNAVKTAFPCLEVIVITAYGDQLAQTNAIRDGAYAFVGKPLDPPEFLGLVERAIAANRLSKGSRHHPVEG